MNQKNLTYMLKEFCKLEQSFPFYLKKDINFIRETNALKLSLIHDAGVFVANVDIEKVHIPERIHLVDNIDFDKYSPLQKNILYCYYTRHYDGFIREKYINKIIKLNNDWAIPYVIKLLGEYVIEVLNVIYKELENIDRCAYKRFIENNLDFYQLTTQRVISYWDCYHRNIYKYKEDYVGFKILDFINTNFLK